MKFFFRHILSLLILTIIPLASFAQMTDQDRAKQIKEQAEQGIAEAQYILGNMYAQGFNVEQNLKKSFQWIEKSAKQGYAAAEFDLASKYDIGEGIETNLQEAAIWYEKVAKKGEAAAAFNLASMYESGQGLPKDLINAYAWFEAAAIMGFEAAKTESKNLVQSFDASTLEKADAKAAELINQLMQNHKRDK